MRTPMLTLALVITTTLVWTVPLEAQIGSRLRRAVAERAAGAAADRIVGQDERAAQDAAPSAVVNQAVVEITPELLDRFSAALAAEYAEIARLPQLRASLTDDDQWSRCYQRLERDARYIEFMRRLETSDEDDLSDRLDQYVMEQCGETEDRLQERPARIASLSMGVSTRQYGVLKERIVPFCTNPGSTGRLVYKPGETQALRPRCDDLLPAVKKVL
jgi:hypothetical protein